MIPRQTVALIGFMGAGKSTLGAALAEALGVPFVDLDARIEATAGPIPDIFARKGEAAFRALEAEALRTALDGPPVVLACGGGAPCQPGAMDQLLERATVVFLDAPFEALAERLAADTRRPLWGEGARALYARRRPVYERAPLRVDASAPPDRLARRVLAELEAAWSP